jgi:hypothetical protein
MMPMRLLVLIMLSLMTTGCSMMSKVTPSDIRANHSRVNVDDGVNKAEAIVIAQMYLLSRGDDDRILDWRPYRVFPEFLWHKDNGDVVELATFPSPTFQGTLTQRWIVYFKDRHHTVGLGTLPYKPLFVEVDMISGDVFKSGIRYR